MDMEATMSKKSAGNKLSLICTARPKQMSNKYDPSSGELATPSLRPPLAIPFLWEDAPGKPKMPIVTPDQQPAATMSTTTASTDHDQISRSAPPLLLKLPPRLQPPSSTSMTAEAESLHLIKAGVSRSRSGRSRSKAGLQGLFSWRNKVLLDHEEEFTAAQACNSPSFTSSSSSSSSASTATCSSCSTRHGGQETDGHKDEKDKEKERPVRITRFTRTKSLSSAISLAPTSHLWATIREAVKQVVPWRRDHKTRQY